MEELRSSQNLPSQRLALWLRYSRYIYKLCVLKCKDPEFAHEFYQEIYIKYHLNAANVANHTKPGLWFKRVVDNEWNNILRSRLRQAPCVAWECHEEAIDYNTLTPDSAEYLDIAQKALAAGDSLNSLERMLLEYLYLGFSFSELSQILGLSTKTLRNKVRAAIEKLLKAGLI